VLGSRDLADVLYATDLVLEERGRYYALVFPPITDSGGRKFWVYLEASSVTEETPVAVRAGYVDAVGGLLYINEYRATGDLDFGAYYRGWPGLWTLRVVGERILPRLVVERLSQYKPRWAKGPTFGRLTGLLVLGCIALLWFSWPKRLARAAESHSSPPFQFSRIVGVGTVLLVTLLVLGWRDLCAAIGIAERRVQLDRGATTEVTVDSVAGSTGERRVTHDLLVELEFARRRPEPRFVRGRWVGPLSDGAHTTSRALPAIEVPGTSRVRYRLHVPFGAQLRFQYGGKEQDNAIAVQIGAEQVWRAATEAGRWQDATLDLRRWGGHIVVLSLVAEGGGRALWGSPQVTSERTWLYPYPLEMAAVGARAVYARFVGVPGTDTQGDVLELLGYKVLPGGDGLQVTLYWRAVRPLAGDYTVFVHALDATGRMCGQKDSRPLAGTYPTFSWPTVQVIEDRYEVPLECEVVRLAVGLYELKSLDRLPAYDVSDRRLQDDTMQLEELSIAGERQ
jgi:hypothetical protein